LPIDLRIKSSAALFAVTLPGLFLNRSHWPNPVTQLKQTRSDLDQAEMNFSTAKNDLPNSMTDDNIRLVVAQVRADLRWLPYLDVENQKRMLAR
jgi:hypothetical protein